MKSKNVLGKVVELTTLEAEVMAAIKEESEYNEDQEFGAALDEVLARTKSLSSMKALGGVITSLRSKYMIEFLDGKEYSLGCNHVKLYD